MKYGYDDIDKIVGFSTWNEKKKLDSISYNTVLKTCDVLE